MVLVNSHPASHIPSVLDTINECFSEIKSLINRIVEFVSSYFGSEEEKAQPLSQPAHKDVGEVQRAFPKERYRAIQQEMGDLIEESQEWSESKEVEAVIREIDRQLSSLNRVIQRKMDRMDHYEKHSATSMHEWNEEKRLPEEIEKSTKLKERLLEVRKEISKPEIDMYFSRSEYLLDCEIPSIVSIARRFSDKREANQREYSEISAEFYTIQKEFGMYS